METCDQSLTFEQPLESGKFDLLYQKAKCAVLGLFRKKVASAATESDSEIEGISAMDSEEAVGLTTEEKLSASNIPDETIEEFKKTIHGILIKNFSLQPSDLPEDFVEDIIIRAKGNTTFFDKILFEKLQHNTALLNKATSEAADKLEIKELPDVNLDEFVQDVRSRIGNCIRSNNYSINIPAVIQDSPLFDSLIEANRLLSHMQSITTRKEALAGIGKVSFCKDVMKNWEENPHCLSDDQLSELFETNQNNGKPLSTFCGSAFFGLLNKRVANYILKYEKDSYEYSGVNRECKQSVINNVDPSRFSVENSILTRNGSDAFKAFYHTCLKDGDSILVTSEEYDEIINIISGKDKTEKNKKKINIHKLPQYVETEAYLESLRSILENTKTNYILISAVSRRGSVFPLKEINQMRREVEKKTGRKIHLIVDGCQAMGRWDMAGLAKDCEPDVFFASSQKGTDLGPIGFLGLSSDFASREGYKIQCEEVGSLLKADMERFRYGLDPEPAKKAYRNDINKNLFMKTLLTPVEKQKANHQLAIKFAKLLRAVSIKSDERLKILYPTSIFVERQSTDQEIPLRERKNLRQERLSNIFELKVEGLTRDMVQEIAEKYGFSVDLHDDEAEEGVSFRIALHPFMGNNSLKILAYALHECCVEAAKEECRSEEQKKAAA